MTDEPPVKVQVYRGEDGNWYWRKVARNGKTVADSGEGYTHRIYAREAATRWNPDAVIEHLPEDEPPAGEEEPDGG